MTASDPSAGIRLTARRRSTELDELARHGDSRPVDLLVIGAGITGAGVALDAASRGLETVLVEANDLAHGTSRWSSKLVHGGLRYLASGNVGIARRSAVERGVLMERTAPHLARRLAQVVPVHAQTSVANSVLPRFGFLAGDALRIAAGTSVDTLPRSRTLRPAEVAEWAPTVRRDDLRLGYLNWDGQLVDDARLVTAVARTAAGHGARVLTRTRAVEVTGSGARLVDELTGEEIVLRARAVINAAGVWAGQVDETVRIRPSRGTHVVVSSAALGHPTGALTVPIPGETNRFCFAMPEQLGRVYIGLTDVDAPGDIPDVPEAPQEDVDELLRIMNTALDRQLNRDDVLGAFAGLRPLIDAGEGRTADLSRDHALLTREDGLLSVVGGKLTEYRLMAEQAVDSVVQASGMSAPLSRTRDLPVVGAPGHPASEGISAADLIGLSDSLIARFGREAWSVVRGCPEQLGDPLRPVADGIDVTIAEIAHHVLAEGALDADDVLDRRTRIGLVPADREAARGVVDEIINALS